MISVTVVRTISFSIFQRARFSAQDGPQAEKQESLVYAEQTQHGTG